MTAPMAKQASFASGATPMCSAPVLPSAATMPATWVPWPLPRSVLSYGEPVVGTTSIGSVPAFTYSGLTRMVL